jgi:CheY-like chemotaxis protein
LLADDNTDMRAYVGRLLASRFEVQAVEDGQAAIDMVALNRWREDSR